MKREGIPTVAGNHDLLIAGAITDDPRQIDRMQATAYNAGLLFPTPGAIDYLLSLPLILERDDFTVVHHSPFSLPHAGENLDIGCFGYLDQAALEASIPAWRECEKRLIISGHDHVPTVFELPDNGKIMVHRPEPKQSTLRIGLKQDSRYWVKAGSVGGPYRDGVPAANSVLYDSEAGTITLFRIPFAKDSLTAELGSHSFCRNLPTLRKYAETLRTSGAW